MRSQKKRVSKQQRKSRKLRKLRELRGGESRIHLYNNELVKAAKKGNFKIVKSLLDRGANIDHSNYQGITALALASFGGHLKIVELLLDRGANIDHSNYKGSTALIMASDNGHLEIVQLLLDRNANINIQNFEGITALMWASRGGHLEIVQLLLERGADVNIQNKFGEKALTVASKMGHLEIVKILKEHIANNIKFITIGGESFTMNDLNLDVSRDRIPIEEIYSAIYNSEHAICKDITTASKSFNIVDNTGATINEVDTRHPHIYSIIFIDSPNCDTYNNNCGECIASKKCKYKKYGKIKQKTKGKAGKCILKSHKANNNSKYIMNNSTQC